MTYSVRRDRTVYEAASECVMELDRLGARDVVISTNMKLGVRSGEILSGQTEPLDPGVSVFFNYKGQKSAIACDRWTRVADNLYAIAKTIEALRGIDRWGSGEMVRAAFTGFRALPLPQRPWRQVFGFSVDETPPVEEVDRRHLEATRRFHPDIAVGLDGLMAELNAARDEARRELGS